MDQWKELHVTFKVDKPFNEGWGAYLACDQQDARLRVDLVRLYEGDYVAGTPAGKDSQAATAGAKNLIANASFEQGTSGWRFTSDPQQNVRRTYRKTAFQLSRLLGNMGVAAPTPLLARFSSPVTAAKPEKALARRVVSRSARRVGRSLPFLRLVKRRVFRSRS